MPILKPAPADVLLLVNSVMDQYHAPLRDAGVKIDLLFAEANADEFGDKAGAPVRLHGYPCAAVAKVNSYKLRVQGHGDCEITIDGDQWPTMSEEEQRALLDHELTYFELKLDKDGLLVRDDLDRPKVRIRKHDHQFGWFDCVARRHGKASFEVRQAEAFVTGPLKQLWLPFLREGFADIKDAKSIPAMVRITSLVTETFGNVAITINTGEEYDAEVAGGEVLAVVGNHKVTLRPGVFEVIKWREAEEPSRRRKSA